MGVESYLVVWVFTDECCHPNRFRVELMLIESFEMVEAINGPADKA